jgi:hypothetical protein
MLSVNSAEATSRVAQLICPLLLLHMAISLGHRGQLWPSVSKKRREPQGCENQRLAATVLADITVILRQAC